MVAIAISAIDPVLRSSLEQLPREDPAITLVGSAESPSALLALAENHHIDVVLAEAPPSADWQVRHERAAWVVILDRTDEDSGLDALWAGASAILHRSADRKELVHAIKTVSNGLVVLQRQLFTALLNAKSPASVNKSNDGYAGLTPREFEVLTAMADGASNKAVARRLGIS